MKKDVLQKIDNQDIDERRDESNLPSPLKNPIDVLEDKELIRILDRDHKDHKDDEFGKSDGSTSINDADGGNDIITTVSKDDEQQLYAQGNDDAQNFDGRENVALQESDAQENVGRVERDALATLQRIPQKIRRSFFMKVLRKIFG